MNKKSMTFKGIKTNNIKDINIEILYNKITAITGVSGGGKSSLAYATVYAICSQEFNILEKGAFEDFNYKVECFSGVVPAIAIRQSNYNNNPKSTIYSFLDFPNYISSFPPSRKNKINYKIIKLNKTDNECTECHGRRYNYNISDDLVVDNNIPICENPFRPWHGYEKNKYTTMLKFFCKKNNIDCNKKFRDLSSSEKSKLLYGEESSSERISFSVGGKRRTRRAEFCGVKRELENFLISDRVSEYNIAIKYSEKRICGSCSGSGINKKLYSYSKILGFKFFDFLTLPINELVQNIDILSDNLQHPAEVAIKKKIIALQRIGLGYLNLNRTIPTLSGGELQKMLFSQLLNTKIKNVLFVIDEISSQVSIEDKHTFISSIKEISKNNTILMVDHDADFISAADHVIYIGPYPGKLGGYICDPYGMNIERPHLLNNKKITDFFSTPTMCKNNLKHINVKIPVGCLTGIFGKSGSGKSSFAQELSEKVENVIYISQKQLKGNIKSTIATYLEASKPIAKFFSKHTGKSETYFVPVPGGPNTCKACNGTGVIEISKTFDKNVRITCPDCNGLLFSSQADELVIDNISVKDFYCYSFSELEKKFPNLPKKISDILYAAKKLGLSHLSFNRKISTLSGGEARRIKLIKYSMSKRKSSILIVDEPGAGLDNASAYHAISYIREKSTNYKSIIVIDHKEVILRECDYTFQFGPGSGPDGGYIIYHGLYQNHASNN